MDSRQSPRGPSGVALGQSRQEASPVSGTPRSQDVARLETRSCRVRDSVSSWGSRTLRTGLWRI